MMTKRYAAEFCGAFILVFAPVALAANGQMGSLLGMALLSGFALMVPIYALGAISGGHFNPAVTLALTLAKRFPTKLMFTYMAAQFAGAIAAAGFACMIFGQELVAHGANMPTSTDPLRNLFLEIFVGFLLPFVVLGVATDKRTNSAVPAFAIGMTVMVGIMIAGPVSGCSMNPARSVGPALFAGVDAIKQLWLYLAGPFIGAILAAKLYEWLRIDQSQACGAPNELLEANEAAMADAG